MAEPQLSQQVEGILTPEGPEAHYAHQNIVLPAYKCIYLFIPKVACTSFKHMAARWLGFPEPSPVFRAHLAPFPVAPLPRIKAGDFQDYVKFAFVRNPWARLVSCYRNKITSPQVNHPWVKDGVFVSFLRYQRNGSAAFWADMPFAEFVHSVAAIDDDDADSHFRSQYWTLVDNRGDLNLDFLGRFERLQRDYRRLLQVTGLPELPLLHAQRSRNQTPWRDCYDRDTWALVGKRFQRDIELFGYGTERYGV